MNVSTGSPKNSTYFIYVHDKIIVIEVYVELSFKPIFLMKVQRDTISI